MFALHILGNATGILAGTDLSRVAVLKCNFLQVVAQIRLREEVLVLGILRFLEDLGAVSFSCQVRLYRRDFVAGRGRDGRAHDANLCLVLRIVIPL